MRTYFYMVAEKVIQQVVQLTLASASVTWVKIANFQPCRIHLSSPPGKEFCCQEVKRITNTEKYLLKLIGVK